LTGLASLLCSQERLWHAFIVLLFTNILADCYCYVQIEDHYVIYAVHLIFSSRLGGVVVSVLATGPKGCLFKPGRGDGFLRAIKIRSTPSFRWRIKPEVPCRKIFTAC
jgi:hypothetical protein